MNIIEQPEILSFVGNLNDFIITGLASDVNFSLSNNEGDCF